MSIKFFADGIDVIGNTAGVLNIIVTLPTGDRKTMYPTPDETHGQGHLANIHAFSTQGPAELQRPGSQTARRELPNMTTEPKTIDFGTLSASTDSWLLVREHVRLLHIPFDFDASMEGKTVSVIGRMGIPEGSPHTKLIVEKMVLHDDIAARAQAIHESGQGGSAEDNWRRAEQELLGV